MTAREFLSRYKVGQGRVSCTLGGLDQWCKDHCPIKQRMTGQLKFANCSEVYYVLEKELKERDEKIMEILK